MTSPSSMRRLAVIAMVGFGLTGCAQLLTSIGKGKSKSGEDDENAAKTAPLPSACNGYSWNPDAKEDAIMHRVCDNRSSQMVTLSVARAHRTFDDREPDVLVAANNVIDCAESCGERTPIAKVVTGYYATVYDRAKLQAALSDYDVDREVRQTYLDKAMASIPVVETMVSELDSRRRKMYFDAFWDVVDARQAYFDRHGDAYAELDGVRERAVAARGRGEAPQDLIDQLESLRSSYLAQCEDDTCRFDPFVITATRELVLLHIAGGHHLAAHAEHQLLGEKAAGRRLFSVESGSAIYRAMAEERRQADQYRKAKQGGVDAATLKARFGDEPPLPVDPDRGLIGSSQLPNLLDLLDGGPKLRMVGGPVSSVQPATDGMVRVNFIPNVTKRSVKRCFRTDRVVAVRWQGNRGVLEYERKCQVIGEKTDVKQKPPVMVPKTDVVGVKPGELLEAMIDEERRGLVVRTSAELGEGEEATNRILQVRSARVGGV
ncbi:MAG: hypothetical protein AAF928_03115 [Myxococcota bacterium]